MKVRCIDAQTSRFTKGKTYEVINNYIKDESNDKYKTEIMGKTLNIKGVVSQFELVEEETAMFKVGDKVKYIGGSWYCDVIKGNIYKIVKINKNNVLGFENICSGELTYDSKYFELVKETTMKLSDIKERWLVVFENGKEGAFTGEEFKVIENGKYTRDSRNIEYYNEDLTHKNNKAWSIVKVMKPRYEEVWIKPIIAKKKVEITFKDLVKDYEDKNDCELKVISQNKPMTDYSMPF